MPIIKSAKKRVKIAGKARARNSKTKRALRESLKSFSKAVETGKSAEILKAELEAASAIDTAAKKNVIHKNKAARQKASLSARAKAAGAKTGKTTAKKAPAKASTKSATKPKTAKKPAKATTKKPAAKKTTSKK